jgi:transposase
MKLSKIKTDKSDAKMICLYGQQMELKLWQGPSANQLECLQMVSLLDNYTKQSTALKNKIHSHSVLSKPSKAVVNSLKRSLKHLQKEMTLIEGQLSDLVKLEYQQTLTKVQSIPGLGRKTAIMLIVSTDGFKRFENASQVCSFAGLTPVIRQSGTSIRGKARISKTGNAKLRNLLFMCSLTACKHNKACREIFERIINKGKSRKLALMAVCNKLIKQAFALANSGLEYDVSYRNVPKLNLSKTV